jgi:hypothetical protein
MATANAGNGGGADKSGLEFERCPDVSRATLAATLSGCRMGRSAIVIFSGISAFVNRCKSRHETLSARLETS